jgi:hypothetical protein
MARARAIAVCVLALAVPLAACGESTDEKGKNGKQPAREGLALPLGGIDYNVFITRQLNLRIPPDRALYRGPDAPKGQVLYGIFLQACNHGKRAHRSIDDFTVVDNQGNRFRPKIVASDNPFAYHAKVLQPDQCIPESGSVAQQSSTAGALLVFQFPVAVTENRPLDLEMVGGFDSKTGKPELLTVELDL